MTIDPKHLLSDLAQGGPALFFPDPPTAVTFNFDQGIAAEETFPIEDFKELMGDVLDRDGGLALEYISFDYDKSNDQIVYLPSYIELMLGHTGLRAELATWLGRTQGIGGLGADNFILTSGSVQAIALAVNAFVNPGDGVLVEAATFPYAMRFMQMRGADIRTVDIDQDGLVIESLEARLEEFRRDGVKPKLLYVIPTFQLPTCVVMPEERRRRLLEIAEKWELIVLEDSIYADLRYGGDPVPSLRSMDTSGLVIQSHGFSKVLAPALRLGWMCASEQMIHALASVRQDLGVSQWMCRMMADYLAQNKLDPHIERANAVYRRKRDIAVQAVREHCGGLVDFDVPDGGFYLWLRIDDSVDWDRAQHAAAMSGVFCRPGEKFLGREAGQGYLRLAYSHAPDHEIERGIKALGDAITSNVRATA
ncbi:MULTISPECIES: aminotransferase-like domain-containing protein [unclassified Rhodococcus (in: high G+C Gram-positive bacteria)]|uniref:aminotransferase-like domain-containing protein n=1 Tax=unclassified Rhodococcus (in: high G+C Gram-positive bacteria) TaxID=192944 RepID=UPI000E0A4A39|nr:MULTISPECIES: PLP-dependent aminotransferase family protein [unclassified Rhodococcus (in: high G+C Gram-positive bacteria)]QKT10157.1 PLP-dependent aminotransferase family protein [Rhodococcus sp. W8901]RDI30285.1 2-aminoadipate transaminase [Rhodococcus sp. AG1013]